MKHALYIIIAALFLSCDQDTEMNKNQDFETQLREKFLNAAKGDTIEIPEGKFELTGTLILHSVPFITLRGKGQSQTVLSFKNQKEGGEGITISDSPDLILENLSVHDSKGDGIKIMNARNLTIRNVAVGWTNGPNSANGKYGIHVSLSEKILIEKCAVTAASNAGIFVSQAENIIIRDNITFENVTGLQTENCFYADIHKNKSYNNTGGIIIAELPGLSKLNGHSIRIYENSVKNNNYLNFSSPGNVASMVPSGTGILLISTRNVEVFKNEIEGHHTTGAAIISFFLMRLPISDSNYNPYSSSIFVHHNKFDQPLTSADTSCLLGKIVDSLFHENIPHVLFDGFVDPKFVEKDGKVREAGNICLQMNGEIKFSNINAPARFEKIIADPASHSCEQGELPPVEL